MIDRPTAFSLVRTLSRFVKAVAYYDEGHPVLSQLERETILQLERADQGDGALVACAGRRILFSTGEPPLYEPLAASFASHLLERSIVALRLHSHARAEDVGRLIRVLGESADRIRHAGGVLALLGDDVQGVGVFEVDLAALYAGGVASVEARDPLVAQALQEVLRLEQEQTRDGTALGLSFQQLSTPESLGSFLDDLIEKADPALLAGQGAGAGRGGTAASGAGPGGVSGSTGVSSAALTAEEVASFGSEAFVTVHETLQASGNTDRGQLLESARVLTRALERLNADARFALLARLANAEAEGPGWQSAMQSLSQQINSDLIVRTVSAVLAKSPDDPEAVQVIGALLRQLRPVESERRGLMEQLDAFMEKTGRKKMDGVLWQELQSAALNSDGHGLLEIPFRRTQGSLVSALAERMVVSEQTPAVQQALTTLDPVMRLHRSARVMARLILNDPEVSLGTVTTAVEILRELESSGVEAPQAAGELVHALVVRADKEASPNTPLARKVRELLNGRRAAEYTVHLVETLGIKPAIVTRAVVQVLSSNITRATRDELIGALARLDSSSLTQLRVRLPDEAASAVGALVRALLQATPDNPAPVMRQALRNRDPAAKATALLALGRFPSKVSVQMLAVAAGCEGDAEAAKVLGVDARKESDVLLRLQQSAVEALASTHSDLAVDPLLRLLQRPVPKGLLSRGSDPHKRLAARALAALRTQRSRDVLKRAAASGDKAVRDAVEAALRK